jgi:type II secretory pathway pseudopilin PulG
MSATERTRLANPAFFRVRSQGHNSQPPAPFARFVRDPGLVCQPPDKGVVIPAYARRAGGFTYLGLLIAVALMGLGLAAYGELYSHAAQREKEAELLFIGAQFRDAIASYYNRSPGAKVYPKKIDDLIEDNRFPMPQHHLRQLFRDPMTETTDWGLVEAPGGGFMGVYSRSEETPIKTGNFAAAEGAFEGAEHYTKWVFAYSPSGSGQNVAPAKRP